MAEQQQSYPPLRDPDNVAEILCDGPFNLSTMGDLVTLTFTQVRPKADELFAGASAASECIVRARIVLPSRNTLALRDLLNTSLREGPSDFAIASTGGGRPH